VTVHRRSAARQTAPRMFAAFREVLTIVEQQRVQAFAEIENDFLKAMSAFDRSVVAGRVSSGENQGKGLFFNRLIVSIVEHRSGTRVAQRAKRPGILTEQVDVDLCFPPDRRARPALIAEVKMAGTPKHPRSPRQGWLGRPASADVDKRIREVALNVIDLKLADVDGSTAPIGDITSWIQSTKPSFFALFGLRVTDENDLRKVLHRFQYLANSYANGVGLALYAPSSASTNVGLVTYRSVAAPGGMSMDDAITRMARLIKSAAAQPIKLIPTDKVQLSDQAEP